MKINDTHNWFYSSTYDCFLWGEYLSSSKPESCTEESGSGESGGTVNYVTYCEGTETACKNAMGPLFRNIISSSVHLPEGHHCVKRTLSIALNWKDVEAVYDCFPLEEGWAHMETPDNNSMIAGAN